MKIKLNRKKLKDVSKKIIRNPMTMYLIGGFGFYLLGKSLYQIYLRNPKVNHFIKNLTIGEEESRI